MPSISQGHFCWGYYLWGIFYNRPKIIRETYVLSQKQHFSVLR
jgi:hypothetical protein